MATEKRLIDANAYDAILKNREETLIEYSGSLSGAIKGCRALLAEEPTVDAVEVVHGRWEDMYDGKYDNPRFRCSVCKEKSLFKDKRNELGNWMTVQALTPFCPHCGATLDGGSDDA